MSQGFTHAEIGVFAEIFPPVRPARGLLLEAGFPMAELPAAPETALGYWEQVSESLAHGVLPGGRQAVLALALQRYPDQAVFQDDVSGRPAPAPASPAAAGSRRVLVIGASPADQDRIRPDRDARAIESARASRLTVAYCPAAAATDLQRILDFRPDILHLACHGDGGYLVFEDAYGEGHRVAAADVAATLRLYQRWGQDLYQDPGRARLSGVVLSSCAGDDMAALFDDVADRVVAHRGALDDGCAVTFTHRLYEALEYTPDLGVAARLAAQHTLLHDQACATVVSGLIVRPEDP